MPSRGDPGRRRRAQGEPSAGEDPEELEIAAEEEEPRHRSFWRELPVLVIANVLGVPTDQINQFKEWSDRQVEAMGSADPQAAADNRALAIVIDELTKTENADAQLLVLDEMLRIGREGIVTFPNFGHWKCRLYLGARGRMPVSKFMPYTWYNTPNIHFCTVRDFEALCSDLGKPFVAKFIEGAQGADAAQINIDRRIWAGIPPVLHTFHG